MLKQLSTLPTGRLKTLALAGQKKRESARKIQVQITLQVDMNIADWDQLTEHFMDCHNHPQIVMSSSEREFCQSVLGFTPANSYKCKIK